MSKNSALSEIQNQIMWNRLIAIVEEQAQTLIRTAFSTSAREAGDLSAGVNRCCDRLCLDVVVDCDRRCGDRSLRCVDDRRGIEVPNGSLRPFRRFMQWELHHLS